MSLWILEFEDSERLSWWDMRVWLFLVDLELLIEADFTTLNNLNLGTLNRYLITNWLIFNLVSLDKNALFLFISVLWHSYWIRWLVHGIFMWMVMVMVIALIMTILGHVFLGLHLSGWRTVSDHSVLCRLKLFLGVKRKAVFLVIYIKSNGSLAEAVDQTWCFGIIDVHVSNDWWWLLFDWWFANISGCWNGLLFFLNFYFI